MTSNTLASSSLGPQIDALPTIVFETDLQQQLLHISAQWTVLTGQSEADALGVGWVQKLDASSVSISFSEMETMAMRGEPIRYVVRCHTARGTSTWLRVVARLRLVDGQPFSMIGTATEVDDIALEEDATRVRVSELEHQEARAEALLSAWPDLVFHVGERGNFLGYRAGDARKLYAPPSAFVGKLIEEVMPPEIARRSREAMLRARESGQLQEYTYELWQGDSLAHFEARVLSLAQGDYMFVIRDVSEQRRNEAELVAAREEALERSRLKTQFLANVSHEIRTPLNGILGVTQLLKQHKLPDEFSEYVDVLQGAGESLLAIVNDVLDLSKIEANRLELETRVFDLDQVVRETARTFLAVAQRKGVELIVDVAEGTKGPVRGDATRVRQIINNLVGNGLKFTDNGHVRVTVARIDERISIEVEDTGSGIAAEHFDRIFEAFEQADIGVQRRYGGTGLGLAITRRLARLMGGDVALESKLGKGSTFTLTVPLPTVVITHTPSLSSRVTPAPKPLKVLLAEDDPVNASMTAALLGKLGHKVSVVRNGRECVAQSAREDIDLVLMDVLMPELDGLEATRLIREREKGGKRHLPIVALIANAMKGDDLRCLSAGMDAYLPKPVTVGALKDLLIWFGSQDA